MTGHLPKDLRRRPQTLAIDMTLLPYYGADARTDPHVYRSKPRRGTSSFYAYASAYIVRSGQRYTVALMPVTRGQAPADTARELLARVRRAVIPVGLIVVDREFYSVEAIRYFLAARYPFLMPVLARGRPATHPSGPSGSQAFKRWKRGGWARHTPISSARRKATVAICVKCRNRRGERGKKGREALAYACWGIGRKSPDWVRATYRKRFGIEISRSQCDRNNTLYQVERSVYCGGVCAVGAGTLVSQAA